MTKEQNNNPIAIEMFQTEQVNLVGKTNATDFIRMKKDCFPNYREDFLSIFVSFEEQLGNLFVTPTIRIIFVDQMVDERCFTVDHRFGDHMIDTSFDV